jgi:cytoplasmic iron level regulating protein YaaA (DUF328/UPF0246 family)
MQILIGCAKVMKGTASEWRHLSELYTDPIFQLANHYAEQLVRYDADELQQMLHVNKALATENYLRYQSFMIKETRHRQRSATTAWCIRNLRQRHYPSKSRNTPMSIC